MPRADCYPPDSPTRVRASVLLAVALHAATLLLWKIPPTSPGTLENPQSAVEVSLVREAPPAGSLQAEAPTPPSPEPPKAAPPKSPPPEPPMAEAPKAPDLLVTAPRLPPIPNIPPPPPTKTEAPPTVPDPPPPAEPLKPPQPVQKPEQPAPAKTPDAPPRAAATPAKASPSPGAPKATQGAAPAPSQSPGQASATTGGRQPTLVKPVYSVPPTVRYPSESRAANEQGTVVLRITVNADGRPVNVTVARGSGFTRLDRAAVEGGWRCRVQNAQAGAQFEAPLRFSLAQ